MTPRYRINEADRLILGGGPDSDVQGPDEDRLPSAAFGHGDLTDHISFKISRRPATAPGFSS